MIPRECKALVATARMKSVNRTDHDGAGLHGWYVRISIGGSHSARETRQEWFGDPTHGGPLKALRAALRRRNALERELGLPATAGRRPREERSPTGRKPGERHRSGGAPRRGQAPVLSDVQVARLRREAARVSGTPQAHGFISRAAARLKVRDSVVSKAVSGRNFRHVSTPPVVMDYSAPNPQGGRTRGEANARAQLTGSVVSRLRIEERSVPPADHAVWLRTQAKRLRVNHFTLQQALRGATWKHLRVQPNRPDVRRPRHLPLNYGLTVQQKGAWVRLAGGRVNRFFPAGPQGGMGATLKTARRWRNEQLAGRPGRVRGH